MGIFTIIKNMKRRAGCALLIMLAACAIDQTARVGGDRDAHGCIGSAGYTYSPMRRQCVRVWEEGLTLLSVEEKGPYTSAVFVLDNDKHERKELFLDMGKSPVMLTVQKADALTWQDRSGKWKLTQGAEGWQLWEKGILRYRSAAH